MKKRAGLLVGLCWLLGACGASPAPESSPGVGGGHTSPLVPVAASRSGEHYRQAIVAPTGDTVVFQVFEPAWLEAGGEYPLVLHSHGYAGSRLHQPDAFVSRLVDAGYYVLSIDQRGFGESSGTVRLMSPDFEGQNLVAVLDWAEDLEGLARRGNGEMRVGAYGSSYGGMYQLLLYAADPRHRLRVMAPNNAPHDLVYGLYPHGVARSGWLAGLLAAGELPGGDALFMQNPEALLDQLGSLDQQPGLRQDPAVYETFLGMMLENRLSDAGANFLRYHSMRYFCDGQAPGAQDFRIADPDPRRVSPLRPPPADVLVTQGVPDTLFNLKDGVDNFECLRALGGDVRLFTHQSGHIVPLSVATLGAEAALDPLYQVLNLPEFQGPGGTRSCGDTDLDDLQFAWFEEKLRRQHGAIDAVAGERREVCISLDEDEAILADHITRGGRSFAIDGSIPRLNSVAGIVGSLLGSDARELLLAELPLYSAPVDGAVLAGLPTLSAELLPMSEADNRDCSTDPAASGCDPILFIGIGHRLPGQNRWEVMNGQITPLRGFGHHDIALNGVTRRLQEGEELALLVYGFHLQFPVSWSRDIALPAVRLQGELQLPLQEGDLGR